MVINRFIRTNVQGLICRSKWKGSSHFCWTAPLLPKRGIYEGRDNLSQSLAVRRSSIGLNPLSHRSNAGGTAAAGRKASRAGGRAPIMDNGHQSLFDGASDDGWSAGAQNAPIMGSGVERTGDQWGGRQDGVISAPRRWDSNNMNSQGNQDQHRTQPSSPHGQQQVSAGTRLRLCDFWSRNGNCLHGDSCKFFHDPNITPRPLKDSHPPRMNADGERAGAGGKSDALDKRGSTQGSPLGSLSNGGGSSAPRRVCDFFVKYGNCRSGRACKFLHVAPNLPNQQAQQQAQQQVQLLQLLKEQQEMQALLAHQQSSQSSMSSQKTLTPSNSSNSLCYAAGLGLDGAGDPSWRDMETAMHDWRDHLQGRDSESEDGGRGWDADRWTQPDLRINGMGYNPQVNRAMMVGGGSSMGDFGSNGGKFTQAAAELASIMAGKQHQMMQQQQQQILGRDGMNGGMRNMGLPIGAQGMMMGGNAKAALQQQAAQLQQMHNGLARGGVGIVPQPQPVGGGRGGTSGSTGAMGQPKVRWAVGEDGTSWFLKGDGWAHNSAGGNRRVCDGFDLMQGICRHGAQCNLLHLIGGPDDDVLRLVENRAGQESLAGVGSDSLGDGGEDLGMMGGMMMGNVQISMSQSSQPKMQQQMGMSTPMPRLNSASTSGSSPSQVMGGPGMSRQHSSSSLSTTGFDRWQSSTGPSDAGSGSDVDSAADVQSDIWRGDAGDSSKLGGIGLSSWSSGANGTGQGVPSDTIGFPGAKALWGGPQRSSEEEVGRLGDYLRSSTLCD